MKNPALYLFRRPIEYRASVWLTAALFFGFCATTPVYSDPEGDDSSWDAAMDESREDRVAPAEMSGVSSLSWFQDYSGVQNSPEPAVEPTNNILTDSSEPMDWDNLVDFDKSSDSSLSMSWLPPAAKPVPSAPVVGWAVPVPKDDGFQVSEELMLSFKQEYLGNLKKQPKPRTADAKIAAWEKTFEALLKQTAILAKGNTREQYERLLELAIRSHVYGSLPDGTEVGKDTEDSTTRALELLAEFPQRSKRLTAYIRYHARHLYSGSQFQGRLLKVIAIPSGNAERYQASLIQALREWTGSPAELAEYFIQSERKPKRHALFLKAIEKFPEIVRDRVGGFTQLELSEFLLGASANCQQECLIDKIDSGFQRAYAFQQAEHFIPRLIAQGHSALALRMIENLGAIAVRESPNSYYAEQLVKLAKLKAKLPKGVHSLPLVRAAGEEQARQVFANDPELQAIAKANIGVMGFIHRFRGGETCDRFFIQLAKEKAREEAAKKHR